MCATRDWECTPEQISDNDKKIFKNSTSGNFGSADAHLPLFGGRGWCCSCQGIAGVRAKRRKVWR